VPNLQTVLAAGDEIDASGVATLSSDGSGNVSIGGNSVTIPGAFLANGGIQIQSGSAIQFGGGGVAAIIDDSLGNVKFDWNGGGVLLPLALPTNPVNGSVYFDGTHIQVYTGSAWQAH
jgi:hypothetical protein